MYVIKNLKTGKRAVWQQYSDLGAATQTAAHWNDILGESIYRAVPWRECPLQDAAYETLATVFKPAEVQSAEREWLATMQGVPPLLPVPDVLRKDYEGVRGFFWRVRDAIAKIAKV